MKYDQLDQLRIAKPCPASWDEMRGDDKKRFCTQCEHNVYNLSEMTRAEATDLIEQSESRVCVRMYIRQDGILMTRDCGKPESAPKRRFWATALLTSLLSAFGLGQHPTRQVPSEDFHLTGKIQANRPITGEGLGHEIAIAVDEALNLPPTPHSLGIVIGRPGGPPKIN